MEPHLTNTYQSQSIGLWRNNHGFLSSHFQYSLERNFGMCLALTSNLQFSQRAEKLSYLGILLFSPTEIVVHGIG